MIHLGGTPVMNALLMKYAMDQLKKEKRAKKVLDQLLEDPEYIRRERLFKMRQARQRYYNGIQRNDEQRNNV